MKKKLSSFIFLLFISFFHGQSSDLLNTNWQITKIVKNGQTYFPPTTMPYVQSTYFYPNSINSNYLNIMSGNFTFNGTSSVFTKNSAGCTLIDYWGDAGQVNQFSGLNCEFFIIPNSGNFSYLVTTTGSEKNLVITNPFGDKIFYNYLILKTSNIDNSEQKIVIYPNPTSNLITIKNLEKNSKLELYEVSGKLVLQKFTLYETSTLLDLQNLDKGIYFLKINNVSYKIQKK